MKLLCAEKHFDLMSLLFCILKKHGQELFRSVCSILSFLLRTSHEGDREVLFEIEAV